jgi:hypothetical protein
MFNLLIPHKLPTFYTSVTRLKILIQRIVIELIFVSIDSKFIEKNV